MKKFRAVPPAIGLGLLFSLIQVTAADAAEVKVFAARAIATVLKEIGPEFERTSGHRLNVISGLPAQFIRQINAGEPVDVVVTGSPVVDGLIKDGKVIADTRTNLVRSGIGVEVRAGAPKPDISSVEAFKRALLDAKSICYVEQGATGIYLKGLLERLGIAEQLKAKTKLLPPSNPAAFAVANGEAEIGMTQISEILPYAGAELVGPLPAEIGLFSVYPAAVGAGAKEPDAAKALIRFLTTPAAIPVLKSKGLEPG